MRSFRPSLFTIATLLAFGAELPAVGGTLPETRAKAEKGDAAAQYALGFAFKDGKGVAYDPTAAVQWWRKAAEQGHVDAQSVLGYTYYVGEITPQNPAEAVKWLRKAADNRLADAQLQVSLIYERGEGVTKDLVQALMWIKLAAAQGNQAADLHQATLELDMTQAQIAEADKMVTAWQTRR